MSACDKHNPLARSYVIALFKSLDSDYVTTWNYTEVCKPPSNYVRISEPLTIRFKPLADDEVIQNAVAAFDAAEQEVLNECNRKVSQLRQQKANLLALTHQVAP